ncbi:hypothetical protein Micbo1qcDRAFT_20854 [Microdochium bolleyi]|uniref:Uncharacterized protein n=1 Tax=Microdochium bolleyi TaxID=196109 RepID=A0A136IRR3_9PEZI|nr:hypothetical protein Micbo1qcDRAFT_20854 [Microdochium bolleyi]
MRRLLRRVYVAPSHTEVFRPNQSLVVSAISDYVLCSNVYKESPLHEVNACPRPGRSLGTSPYE